jgi:hypothetical protein
VSAGENVLVFDTKHQELLCLATATGKLLWRQEIGEPIAAPLVVDDRVLVVAESGRMFVFDLRTVRAKAICNSLNRSASRRLSIMRANGCTSPAITLASTACRCRI